MARAKRLGLFPLAFLVGFLGGMAGSVVAAHGAPSLLRVDAIETQSLDIMPGFDGQCGYRFGTDGVPQSWGGRLVVKSVGCDDARMLFRVQPKLAGYAIWSVPMYTNHSETGRGLQLAAQGGNWPKVPDGQDWAGYNSTTLELLAQRQDSEGNKVARRYVLRAVQTGGTFEETAFSLQLCYLDFIGETLTAQVCRPLD